MMLVMGVGTGTGTPAALLRNPVEGKSVATLGYVSSTLA